MRPRSPHGGKAAAGLGPRLAGIDGAPQRALRSAVDHAEVAALALVRGGQQDVGILGIHDHVGAAGVFADFDEALRPCLAAIGGFVEAALAAAFPERPRRRDVDHIRIARVHHDTRDVLGCLEAHVLPGAAGVFALVDAIAKGDAALVVVFAGAHPDNRRILGIDGDGADGVGAVGIEDRRPGSAVVVREEDAAGSFGDQIMAGTIGKDGELRHAAGDESGSDIAHAQAGESARVDGVVRPATPTTATLRWFVLCKGSERNA